MEKPIRARISLLFGALASEIRIQIVQAVLDGPKTVGQIAELVGLQQSNTSQHLAILTRTGVLKVSQQGKYRFYGLRGPRIPKILDTLEDFCRVHQIYGDEDIVPED